MHFDRAIAINCFSEDEIANPEKEEKKIQRKHMVHYNIKN